MFFVSVADKRLSVVVSGLESTVAGVSVSVDSKGVKKGENLKALPASAGEEVLEREGRMDLFAEQRLAEVLAVRRMVRRRLAAGVRVAVVVEESAVLRLRMERRGWGQRSWR